MPENAEALGIILVLLPGFAAAYLVQLLAARRKQSDLDKIVEALIFSLLVYLITLPFFGYSLPVAWRPGNGKPAGTWQVFIVWPHLMALAVLAVVLGTLYSASINHNWLTSPFRWLRVSERSARSSVWNDVFSDIEGFVQVGISGGRSVIGWIRKYSDEDEAHEVFLEEAAWVDSDGKEFPIHGPGVLLTKNLGIEYVMFLNSDSEDTTLPVIKP
ncbi:MAG TPA: DUF6338 family protein [Terracidiphilus sp.]|nr:DUF6338 family protein [Terracidiphilus sp.]